MIYTTAGRLMYDRPLGEMRTLVDTRSWHQGTYLWQIVHQGKPIEQGKWIIKVRSTKNEVQTKEGSITFDGQTPAGYLNTSYFVIRTSYFDISLSWSGLNK